MVNARKLLIAIPSEIIFMTKIYAKRGWYVENGSL